METRTSDILIIGAGQAGLSVSYFLSQKNRNHLVVDKGGIGNAWKQHRWDSFCLVTPNWTIRLPGKIYAGDDPDGFMPRDEFVAYLEEWARSFDAPVESGVEIRHLARQDGMFRAETRNGDVFAAEKVVVATATYQKPRIPALAGDLPAHITHIHAENYKNVDQLGDGATLVVGSGQTGCQIVEDLLRAGRKVFLAVGSNGRLPRRYRGRDCLYWQEQMQLLERTPDMLATPKDRFKGDPHVSGRDRGTTINLRSFAARGCVLTGRLASVSGNLASFNPDLADSLKMADDYAADFLMKVDAHIEAHNLDAPTESKASLEERSILSVDDPGAKAIRAPAQLDMDAQNIKTIIWATGFSFDFSWIEGLETDASGYPVTHDGKSSVENLYFCGLNWMRKRKSGIIYGVGEDAEIVASKLLEAV